MKTATIRQVRNDFGTVLTWIAQGEEVTVLRRRTPVARILPPRPAAATGLQMPDFAARAKAVFGDKHTHILELLLREREESRW